MIMSDIRWLTLGRKLSASLYISPIGENPGLFVPLHFRSWEQKVHRENFRSRGT